MKKEYEIFDHDADVGIRAFGKTLEEAFVNGAKAMSSIMVELNTVEPKDTKVIECEADDPEALFITWLITTPNQEQKTELYTKSISPLALKYASFLLKSFAFIPIPMFFEVCVPRENLKL